MYELNEGLAVFNSSHKRVSGLFEEKNPSEAVAFAKMMNHLEPEHSHYIKKISLYIV